MFAKIFSQIFDSSIVEKPETRFTFMDMLVLADCTGVVDMTHGAISRRTNRPESVIRATIEELEGPDPMSRTPDFKGARIKRLDDHRDWGWLIINYEHFREIASEEQRRRKTLERVRKHRKSKSVTHRNALKRNENKCNDFPSASASSCTSALSKRVQGRFLEWIDVRKAMGKAPKDWEKMFSEQINWLLQYPEEAQLEIISASIRNNWQGLFPPKQSNGSKPLTAAETKLDREYRESLERHEARKASRWNK